LSERKSSCSPGETDSEECLIAKVEDALDQELEEAEQPWLQTQGHHNPQPLKIMVRKDLKINFFVAFL